MLTNRHLSKRIEPDFVKPICPSQSLFFHCVVTCQDRILTPIRGSLFCAGTRERIIGEYFSIGLESTDRSVSPVRQDQLCPGQRYIFGLSPDPQGNYPPITLRDTSLVRASADIGHYAVQIHWVLSKPKTYPPGVGRTANSNRGFYLAAWIAEPSESAQ